MCGLSFRERRGSLPQRHGEIEREISSNSHFEIPVVGQASSLAFVYPKIMQAGMPSIYLDEKSFSK